MMLVLLVAASYALAASAARGREPVVTLAIFSAVSAWFMLATLITEVRTEGLYVRFKLLWPERMIPYSQIVNVEAKRYRPILEYGGWGVRGIPVKAFNVSGNRGVLLTLANGRTLMIGSQRPDQLAAALQAGVARARGS